MDFPGNSNKENEAPKKKSLEKVVTGEVIKRKKPLGSRFKEIFFGGDFKSAARYIAADVLLPAVRNMIVDTSTKGIERLIYGESAVARRRTTEYRPRVQYNSPVVRRDPRERTAMLPDQPPIRNRHDAGEIILASREEAELVVERLIDCIDKYDMATVADLYDLIGLPTTYIDNKWGWTSVVGIEVRQVREGYVIELPAAEAL